MKNQYFEQRNWTLKDEIVKQTMKLLKYISTDYFAVILNTENTQESVRLNAKAINYLC